MEACDDYIQSAIEMWPDFYQAAAVVSDPLSSRIDDDWFTGIEITPSTGVPEATDTTDTTDTTDFTNFTDFTGFTGKEDELYLDMFTPNIGGYAPPETTLPETSGDSGVTIPEPASIPGERREKPPTSSKPRIEKEIDTKGEMPSYSPNPPLPTIPPFHGIPTGYFMYGPDGMPMELVAIPYFPPAPARAPYYNMGHSPMIAPHNQIHPATERYLLPGRQVQSCPPATTTPVFDSRPMVTNKRKFTFIDSQTPTDFVANPNNHGRWHVDGSGKRCYLNGPRNKRPKTAM